MHINGYLSNLMETDDNRIIAPGISLMYDRSPSVLNDATINRIHGIKRGLKRHWPETSILF